MQNIILVGMPSCGKSTVGVVLAKTVNKGFVDTDLLIQQREKKTLQEIINSSGNEYFHQVEESVLLDFEGEDCVIATGGSAIYFDRAMEKFKEKGVIIYLQVTLDTVFERLSNIKTRGVTLEKGQTLADLYEQRVPLYEKHADVTVVCDGCTVEEVVEKIVAAQGY
ncbi:shikimate kinase [Ihubacter sp. rT4E-8]|uniref:shikimate kinase n=1 Tax=Ihubacter sp. rT4E-8 TaxID=3242369 RepID=UPI003CE734BD